MHSAVTLNHYLKVTTFFPLCTYYVPVKLDEQVVRFQVLVSFDLINISGI